MLLAANKENTATNQYKDELDCNDYSNRKFKQRQQQQTIGFSTSTSRLQSISKSRHRKSSTVKFNNTVLCCLIPSRMDLSSLSSELWYNKCELQASMLEAEEEFRKNITVDHCSSLSLHSAMNILHRPCSGKMSHHRILVVDKSAKNRKLIMYSMIMSHRFGGSEDSLIFAQAWNSESATQLITQQKNYYNIIIVDQLLQNNEYGHNLVRHIKNQYHNDCLIIGLSSSTACPLLDTVNHNSDEDSDGSSTTTSNSSNDSNTSCGNLSNDACRRLMKKSGCDIVWDQALPTPEIIWDDLLRNSPLCF